MKMKRSAAAVLAALMIIGMVSCGNVSADSENEADTTTTTTAETEAAAAESAESTENEEEKADEMSEPSAEDEKTEETPAEEETKEAEEAVEETAETTDDAAEKSAETEESSAEGSSEEQDPTYENGVYTHKLYSFTADEKTWTKSSMVSVDCMFQYNVLDNFDMKGTANFNVVSMENSLMKGVTSKDYAEQLTSVYESMDGFKLLNSNDASFGGKDAYDVELEYSIGEATMIMHQLVYCGEGKAVALSYGALDSVYSDVEADFKAVIDSFKIN